MDVIKVEIPICLFNDKIICLFEDCKYKDTEQCRVAGLGVYGIQSCVKYKVEEK